MTKSALQGFRTLHLQATHSLAMLSITADRSPCRPHAHPSVIKDYLTEEQRHGRIVGPLAAHSSFGVIPKSSQSNKWRLILDLSSPEGHSVNDGIDRDLCSLSYVSTNDIGSAVLQFGQGARIAKTDIAYAYRQIPVHPQDRLLLGMQWQGRR